MGAKDECLPPGVKGESHSTLWLWPKAFAMEALDGGSPMSHVNLKLW